jgi:hypothetical protein
MCLSLSPLDISGTFITANLVGNKVIITYSIKTSEPREAKQTGLNSSSRLLNRMLADNNYQPTRETIFAWFLPIKDLRYTDITIRNLTPKDKIGIESMRRVIDQYRREEDTKRRGFSSNSLTKESDVCTLEDGSQVVRASSPSKILDELENVNPQYREKLEATAKQVIDQSQNSSIANCACLLYLFKGLSTPSFDYLSYEYTLNPGQICWLPTVENDHKTLNIDPIITRDLAIIWGGDDQEYARTIRDNRSFVPEVEPYYFYGIFDFQSAYPNGKFDNGFIGINFQDQNIDNISYNVDSNALHLSKIF